MLRWLTSEPRRILIVRLGSIGDVARVLPMLNGLQRRFPDAEIDWVVQSKAADLLRGHPQIDRLFVVPFRRWREALSREALGLARAMRARRYDLVLEFQGMAKGAIWSVVGGSRAVRVGWGPRHVKNFTWLWAHGVRYPPGRDVNRHQRHRVLVDWLGAPDLEGLPPDLSSADTDKVDRFLAQIDRAPRPWIFAYPGSSATGSHKRWDPDRFARALAELRERTGGTILVGWGPAEAVEARALAESVAGRLIPPTTIRELTYLIGRCDLFVGMDTGPMHLAGLVGTPVVGVFGRSDPIVHGPAEHLPGRAVSGPDARHWPGRRRKGLPPFSAPEPEAVVEAAIALLAQSAARRGRA